MNIHPDFLENYRSNSNTLIQKLLQQNKKENLVISSYSILSLLSILLTTSDQNTKDKLEAFVCKNTDIKTYLSDNHALINALQKDVVSSNGLFMHSDLHSIYRSEFTSSFQKNFDGTVKFSNDLVKTVNTWGEKNTKGDIKTILDETMTETILCLANAVCFRAKWAKGFNLDQIEEGSFQNLDGSIAKVTMLHSKEDLYLEDENWFGFAKPYVSDYSFVALLPKYKENNLDQMMDPSTILDTLDIDKLLAANMTRNIAVSMPEFTIEYGIDDLIPFIKKLGDFSDSFSDDLFANILIKQIPVDQIIHKAAIKVDATGTKASAVTAAISRCMIMEEERISLNRPFVFMILHNETRLPIFSGLINSLGK